jgi:hypothetical protein
MNNDQLVGSFNFTVDFNWLTNFVRSLWSEGSFRRALSILEELEIPKKESYEIIRGNLKMIQDPNGKKGIDGMTLNDNWSPDLTLCDKGRYPDPDELYLIERNRDDYAKKYIDQCATEAHVLLIDLDNALKNGDGYRIEAIEDRLNSFPDEIYDIMAISKNDYFNHIDKVNYLFREKEIADKKLDEYIIHQKELDTKKLPDVDINFDFLYGWLLPNGDYYPCAWMDHIWLAEKLGKNEKDIENFGWIKITKSGIGYESEQVPTQKQLDGLLIWCNKHDKNDWWNEFNSKFNEG